MEKYMTIARGITAEKALWVAQNAGLNGKEIQTIEGFDMLEVPQEQSPYTFALEMLEHDQDLKKSNKVARCVQIIKADPGAPREHYFVSQRINAYLFFGYA